MKKLFPIVITGVVLLVGCGSNDSGEKKVQASAEKTTVANKTKSEGTSNVTEYAESVKPIMLKIEKLGKRWDILREKSANGQIDDIEFGTQVADKFLPENLKITESAEEIALEVDDSLVDAHELLIEMLNKQQAGFTEIVSAIDTGDASKVTSANEYLSEARTIERQYVRELEKLQGK